MSDLNAAREGLSKIPSRFRKTLNIDSATPLSKKCIADIPWTAIPEEDRKKATNPIIKDQVKAILKLKNSTMYKRRISSASIRPIVRVKSSTSHND